MLQLLQEALNRGPNVLFLFFADIHLCKAAPLKSGVKKKKKHFVFCVVELLFGIDLDGWDQE